MMNIAVLGTGLMGAPIAGRLLAQGVQVIAWNRSREKLHSLAAQGITISDTPEQALASVDAAILTLTNAQAIREVLFTQSHQWAQKTIIQMGTIAPQESQELAQTIQAHGGDYLEAPVLGSIPQAKAGELIIMVGSTLNQYQRWLPLFKHLGQKIHHMGEVGSAAAIKLALNQLIASLTAAFSLSLGIVQKNNVDINVFMDIVRQSALYAPTFDKKLTSMLERNFSNPNFPTQHLLKDIDLMLWEAQRLHLRTDALEGVKHIVEHALTLGVAQQDYSALFEAIVPR